MSINPTVHLAGTTPRRTACGERIYVGMPGTVTTIPARVTCGRCERTVEYGPDRRKARSAPPHGRFDIPGTTGETP